MHNAATIHLLVLCSLLAAAHAAKLNVDASKVVQQVLLVQIASHQAQLPVTAPNRDAIGSQLTFFVLVRS
jgi:hypothetical protein